MIRHLTAADYRVQPWANGRGETVEIAREDGPEGLLWRVSVAQVVEDGPFSRFPGVDRSLTVIAGPGFRIRGEGVNLQADPLVPVAFPGDAVVHAEGVSAPTRDFNVMTAARLSPARVWLASDAVPAGGLLVLHALTDATIEGACLARGDTFVTRGTATVRAGRILAARLPV